MNGLRKIFVAIPSQRDAVHCQTLVALFDSFVECLGKGYYLDIHPYAGLAPISSCRNYSLAEFLASDCEMMVSIDDDLTWERGALLKTIEQPVDFVFGAYPARVDPIKYPVRHMPFTQAMMADPATGLLEMEGGGFGFVKLSRKCVTEMVRAYPHLEYQDPAAPHAKCWALFDFALIDGVYWGEDMLFARRWREIGGRVWCDPELTFTHIGFKGFTGKYGDWLRARPIPQFPTAASAA